MVTLRAVESSRQLTKSTQNSAPVSKARIAGLAESHLLLFLPSLPSFLLPLLSLLLLPYISTIYYLLTLSSILILSSSSLGIKHSLSALIHRFFFLLYSCLSSISLFILSSSSHSPLSDQPTPLVSQPPLRPAN